MHRTSPTTAAVLEPYLTTQITAIGRLNPLVRAGDADAIHDMRVASRRLKATLATYGFAFASDRGRQLRDELDWLAEVLGAARDHEVQRSILAEFADGPELEIASLALAETTQAALLVALTSERYDALARDLTAFGAEPPWTPEAGEHSTSLLDRSLSRQFRRVTQRVKTARKSSLGSHLDHQLHQVRKAVKRARYATEAAKPVLPSHSAALTDDLSAAQDVFGAHNDLVATRGNERAWAELGVGGELWTRLEERLRTSRTGARDALEPVRRIARAGQALPS